MVYALIALERLWSGEDIYEFPFGISHNYVQPGQDLRPFLNIYGTVFVKRHLSEIFTGIGIYAELVEDGLQESVTNKLELGKQTKVAQAIGKQLAKDKEEIFTIVRSLKARKEKLKTIRQALSKSYPDFMVKQMMEGI